MLIRNWKYADIYRITEIEAECFPKEAWTFRMFADWFQSSAFYGLVAEEDGEIIGYGGLTVGYDDVDLENIAVAEEYRNRGVGRKILQELIREATMRKKDRMFLEVRISNAPAMLLYLKNGFVGNNVRPRYYADGEDALVMIKKLKK